MTAGKSSNRIRFIVDGKLIHNTKDKVTKQKSAIIFTHQIPDMRDRIRVFILMILFWLSYMMVSRGIFLLYNHTLTGDLKPGDVLLSMLYGFWMDGSISGYFVAFAGLLLTISALLPGRWIHVTLASTTITLLVLSSLIVVIDMELYRNWGFRLNTTPLFYMGSAAMGSIDARVVTNLLIFFSLLTTTFIVLYFRFIAVRTGVLKPCKRKSAFVLLIISGLMFLPIRGSVSVAPMNTGFVFFHPTKAYANHAAINVIWNFLYSIRKSANVKYPEDFFDHVKAEKLFTSLYPLNDSTTRILNVKRPNIIMIILESFTADVIEPLGGIKGIAPNLNQLCKEGILFDNFYATGDRTDKGLIGVLSGYPAQPQTSIIKYPAKTQRLPQLNQYLNKLGYKSSFIYGGDVDFANFRSYLSNGGFEHITDMEDFPDDLNVSKWGVHDHFMFEQALRELDTTSAPFFKTILTLSSHEPFDVPMEPYFKGSDEETLFINSCHYTDKSLGSFIEACKKQPWWSTTLIVITADHGHRHPGNKELKDKKRFKIPLLLIGGAVKKDTVIHTLAGQTDIVNTVLAQVDREYAEFKFSKNIFGNNVVPFAAYFFNDGYGFLLPDKHMVFDNPGKQFLEKVNATETDIELSKAYQQILFSDYNKR